MTDFDVKKYFWIRTISQVWAREKPLKMKKLPKGYDTDFGFFSDKHDELSKTQKPVCGRKEPASIQRQRPTKTVGSSELK